MKSSTIDPQLLNLELINIVNILTTEHRNYYIIHFPSIILAFQIALFTLIVPPESGLFSASPDALRGNTRKDYFTKMCFEHTPSATCKKPVKKASETHIEVQKNEIEAYSLNKF